MTAAQSSPVPAPAARLPADYAERVYAGVLGKIIGVYLGRPIENWWYDRITEQLGEIDYYVHERLGVPLIVSDDDISGTFTFVRAMPDHGNPPDLTPEQIGRTWLNYIIEGRTILWWGGLGVSTEHTAFLRLKRGVPAPRSGSAELNGKVVAEQIGSQIFIDGWAMLAPGDPALAADLARRAASVSHDGEAIYGAQIVAAMEAQAFVERDLHALLDCAVSFIPADCVIRRMIDDLRAWRREGVDWRTARERLAASYGYDRFGGGCHMVPNHGLIILALLWGDDDFQKSMMIVNTCGWDTDCNAGNVGCLLGIKNGLAGLDAGADFRTPVRDRMLLPTADGGRCITDAVQEAQRLANVGRALAGEPPLAPKEGARFHFEFPGSLQGFAADEAPECRDVVRLENREGHSRTGSRNLTLHLTRLAPGRTARVTTPTFATPEQVKPGGAYRVVACPTLYPGQTINAELQACSRNPAPLHARLVIRAYGSDDGLTLHHGEPVTLEPGGRLTLQWRVPDLRGEPIGEVGVELTSDRGFDGRVYLDRLTWDGEPDLTLTAPPHKGTAWRHAWVDAADHAIFGERIRVTSNAGRGLLIQGTREWRDYAVSARVQPHLADAAGVAARVQGLQRYYALLLRHGGSVALVKRLDRDHELAAAPLDWRFGQTLGLRLEVRGDTLRGYVDGDLAVEARDDEAAFTGGAIALISDEGRTEFSEVRVRPVGA